jgi:methylglyoxal synthase
MIAGKKKAVIFFPDAQRCPGRPYAVHRICRLASIFSVPVTGQQALYLNL